MRIIIETDGADSVTVARDGQTQTVDVPDAIDGGGPPQELVELLGAGSAEDQQEAGAEVLEAADPHAPEDAGAAPDWLVGVIEGPPPVASSGPVEDQGA